METETTLASIPIGSCFYMGIAGQRDVPCERLSETDIKAQRPNGEWMKMKASPLWNVTTEAQYLANKRRMESCNGYRPVPGHSSTYPYGEH